MKSKIFITSAIIFLAVSLFFPVAQASARESGNLANIQYPVEELGNCKNKSDCKTYCDEPGNADACFAFAEKNNLMSEKEISVAKKFLSGNIKGPGGCKTKDACEEYCNDMSRIDECISFAERNNLIPPQELEEAKKVQSAIAKGVKPPPCGNKKSCDAYCENPEHMEECITFGMEAGFIRGKELEDAQKMLQAVKRGVKPPPCKGKDACDAYCQQEGHFEECANFAVAAGFMSEKDAEMARKTGGKGPGGCKGKEECEAFCNNPDNQETCFLFGKENGMIPEEDLKRMEEGKQQMKQSLGQAPKEVLDCLQSEIGSDMVEKIKSGAVMPPREIGDKMGGCFQKMGPPAGQNCQGEDCKKFQPGPGVENPGGQIMPPQAGPGGCKGPEECKTYCESHQDECKSFYPAGDESQRGPDNQIQQQGQMPPAGQQPPPPNENSPPPPPPASSFFKPESFLGSVLYVFAHAIYSLR